ncbi:MAG TPA: MFS transporter [Micromonosporaceae bacterium]|nr:MFS transporter [Micromonosporaceae bacterium]
MSFTSSDRPHSRWSDVYVAAGARGISSCGDFLAATALALALQGAGAGGLAVSGLLLAATLPLVVLAPLTGRLADRVDSRRLLIGAGLAQAAVCAALAYVHSPALIIVLMGLLACGLAVTQPTLAALLPQLVRRDDLPKASAINQTAGTLGILAGPALAGLLVGQFGVRLPLLLDAASYLALVAAGLLLRTRRGGAPAAGPATERPAGLHWRLRRDPLVLAMAVAIAGVVGGVGAINVIEVFFIRETLGSSETVYGIVAAMWTAGMMVGAWAFTGAARRTGSDGTLVRGMLLMLAGCCVIVLVAAGVPAAGWLIPLWLLGGLFNGGMGVFETVVVARRVPPEVRGRAFAAMGAAIQGAAMVGYLLGGLLLEVLAPRPLVAICGVAGLLAVVAVLPMVVRAGRHEATERHHADDQGATPAPDQPRGPDVVVPGPAVTAASATSGPAA